MLDFQQFKGKKAKYFTLGCKLNFSETASLEEHLQSMGVETALDDEPAQLCVINTCSVTAVADRKGRQVIRRAVKENPGAFVLVMGCYAQLKPEEIARIQGVDVVIGTEEKKELLSYLAPSAKKAQGETYTSKLKDIKTFVPSCSKGSRTRYFLKVQDGCNCFCSYCTIPFARGRSRNGSIASLVEQARDVAARGGKEIVITGVNIGDFGQTTGENLLDLFKALDGVEGIERYRISSLEPDLLSEEIIRFIATSSRFMPHLHLPLQCGSDAVLKLMRRRYDTALFREKVELVKRLLPDCFIGVDVMVGSRGETQEYFQECRSFLESLDVTQLHVFSYSERPGTMALRIDHKVPEEQKHERSQVLLELSDRKTRAFYQRYMGQVMPVLLEKPKGEVLMHGFTPNYIRVEVPYEKELDNRIAQVRLGGFSSNPGEPALVGEILSR